MRNPQYQYQPLPSLLAERKIFTELILSENGGFVDVSSKQHSGKISKKKRFSEYSFKNA